MKARSLAVATLFALVVLSSGNSIARVDGYPYLDNETLGMVNLLLQGVDGPLDTWDPLYWGDDELDQIVEGMFAFARYSLILSAQALAYTQEHTPAYRERFVGGLEKSVRKMFQPRAWQDWMLNYGDDPLAQDNLMYKGYLFYLLMLHRKWSDSDVFESPFELRYTDGRTFSSDLHALSELLHREALDSVDSSGHHHHHIACEPGQVFVVCNTQHRAGHVLYDQIYGTRFSDTIQDWLDWVVLNMMDSQLNLFYYSYLPEETPPGKTKTFSGIFVGATIAFMDVFDHEWAESLYVDYKNNFVAVDDNSPFGPGSAVVWDFPDAEDDLFVGLAKTLVSTGFGMVLAGTYGDTGLQQKYQLTWRSIFGPPGWQEDQRTFGYGSNMAPLVIQNTFPLFAKVIDGPRNIRTSVHTSRGPAFFDQPYLESVANRDAFINQAIYDADRDRLIITVNGGQATNEKTRLVIANLKPSEETVVERNSEEYGNWSWSGNQLVIETPALTGQEESYIISQKGKDGCACGHSLPPRKFALLLLVALGAWSLRSRAHQTALNCSRNDM